MSKYHRAFKLKLAKLADEQSSKAVSVEYGVCSSLIRYWSMVYRLNDSEAFTHRQKPYTVEFKHYALETMKRKQWSLGYTSAFFDLSSPGVLFQWQTLYARKGILRLTSQNRGRPHVTKHSFNSKPSEQMTEKELREELEYLRAENAVLKKLEALAQAKKAKKRP